VLEDDPNFNAGRGAVFTFDGTHELDASIMDGRTRAAGAVADVSATKNPIGLARAVMENSPHVFLAGEGADRFSKERGLPQVPNDYFSTPDRRRQLDEMKAKKVSAIDVEYKYGTVGAVALDSQGHVAAATSTGGTTGKRWGRVGDSPIIGAGTYADDRACAVSATGTGEYFIRVGAAHEICARIRFKGEAAQVAADAVIKEIGELGGDGGVIVVTPKGEQVYSFNTAGMYRGMADKTGRSVAIYGDEGKR
jgi:beta-aspartyl-peptidase (threonine type)